MFEGLVRQLLLGYLGRYIKDIHKEQLKITLWNEEVLLENVELILEAFDYLQLPFALKEGRVGRLSIKIPWKKLGWDPIIILLEDVLVCACQRHDEEWSMDAVERREFAGKKAKLAAAELAKLSRRVCDNQAGKSFISFITAKILDGIQVSIRNVHVLYRNMLTDSAHAVFGLKFSSLTVMKQNLSGVSSGKVRGNQVTKLVEIQGLEIYCSTLQEAIDEVRIDNDDNSKLKDNAKYQGENIYMLAPVDVSMSLLVNRPGKVEKDAPQYSMNVELTGVVVSLDEVQLQQMLTLYDYLSTCRLRERYGRYRPWGSPLSKRLTGWQIVWWHYAQQSVLSDVRKKLRRTSWKYLGERLNRRCKYVKLYKTKLDCLQQEQLLDDDVLWELEQIEKEADIDDILSYRSVAEREIEEFLEKSSSNIGVNGASITADKSLDDERPSGKPRGWLNWLSRGMLGAGGTDDSSQFSGVVSDEVIKDIYEATKFHSVPSSSGDAAADEIYLSSMKFNIRQISATLRSMKFDRAVAELLFEGLLIECKIWEESAMITSTVNSAKIVNPLNKQVILLTRRAIFEEIVPESKQTAVNIQVDISPVNHESELSIQVMLQALEVTFDTIFFLNIIEFYQVLQSFTFQQERVLLSLNGIDDDKVRLLSKAEFILSSRKSVMWDVQFFNIQISIPWENAESDPYKMVLKTQALSFGSKRDIGSFASDRNVRPYVVRNSVNSFPTSEMLMGFQLKDLYDHFEINLYDFKMELLLPFYPHILSVLDKLGASVTLSSCIVPDESILNRFEVYIIISSFLAHFSLSIYGAILGLISNFNMMNSTSESGMLTAATSLKKQSYGARTSSVFCFSVVANLESASLLIDLENDIENSCILMFSLQELDIRLSIAELPEWWISTKALRIITYPRKNKEESHTLCSTEFKFADRLAQPHDLGVKISKQSGNFDEEITCAAKCFLLHYQASRNLDFVRRKYSVFLNDVDLHCYPYVIGLLIGFFEKLASSGASHVVKDRPIVESKSPLPGCGFEFQRFGSSNFFETSTSEWESIPVDNFPFVTINNAGSLLNLESSLIYAIPEWRKVLKLRDRKIRSPRYSIRKGFKQLNAQPLKSTFGKDVLPTLESDDDTDLFAVDLTFSSSRVHLHDSACIVGTITVPTSKSSVVIYEDCFDMLFSSEGLTLSSSWCTQILCDFLWGPSIPNLSPILNMRIRKGSNGSLGSLFELSFSVQHVSCILPPGYLAILIGYFSLADWKPNAKQQPVTETSGYIDTETNNAVTYKFEALDSTLFSPIGNVDYELLKLDIQQFYCTYIENCTSENILKDIPIECLVPAHKVLDKNHCLNIFGRDLSLALMFLKDDASDSLMFNQNSGQRISTLIAPLSADVWIRIPCECEPSYAGSSPPTCIMAKVYDCQLIVDGSHVIVGYEALLDVINQFSSVYAESQGFTSDVLQFLQLKRSLKENNELPAESSSVNLTEIRCSVHSISIKLYTSRSESTTSKLVAKAQMQVLCYSSLRIDEPHCLDISFSSVSLFSLVSSVMLVECTSSCSSSSVIEMKISTAELGEIESRVSLPFVDIWLHLLDWSEVIDLFSSYSPQISKTSTENASSKKSIRGPIDQSEKGTVDVSNYSSQSQSMSSKLARQNMKPDRVFLYLKSENISMTVHIPVRVSGKAFGVFAEPQAHMDSCDILEENQYGFVAVALESRCTELVSNGKTARLKCTVEKTKGTVELCKEMSIQAQPFFQFLHLNLEAEICSNQVDHVQVKAEVQCDSLDVWLSYHIFYFWRCVLLEVPARGSSEFAFSGIDLTINLRKLSLLLIDGKRCSNGPLLEVLMRNSLLCAKFDESKIEASITSDLQVNYNNIHKVLWEPFLEPWMFKLNLNRRDEKNALLNSALMTDIHLTSTSQLNLNLTESLVEVVFRAVDLIADAWGLMELTGLSKSPKYLKNQISDNLYNGRYAPYILQNLTSLPLAFHVCEGPVSSDDSDFSALKDEIIVQPGSSIPIYIDETPEEQLFRYRPSHSSERLSDKQFMDTAHHYIIIRLEGTSIPSTPISMDLVGLSCFEMDFSKSSNSLEVHNVADDLKTNLIGKNKAESDSGYVVPVVVDVSVQRYTKLIRLYSTVVLLNATSTSFEVRFDIPFGVSPKMLDPVYPGQEFPLPLHLAEAGRMRWRPLGNAYLWSEAYNISNILAHENGIGFLRSVVCYPSHPSSDPFRFCISVHDMCLPAFGRPKGGASIYSINTVKQSVENSHQVVQGMDESKKRFLHLVTLSSPLVVNNYLPLAVTLAIESGGVTRTALLSEVETSFFHIDSSHDLAMVFTMHGFGPSILKFPRAETFGSMAKFSGTKFSVSETIVFDSDLSGGPLYVTVEKIMDAVSGAREICISVPFLLYNCTGFPLIVSNCVNDMKGWGCTVPSCYNLEDLLPVKKDGLGLLSSNQDFRPASHNDSLRNSSMNNHIVSIRKNVESHPSKYLCKPLNLSAASSALCGSPDKLELNAKETSVSNLTNLSGSSSRSNLKSPDYVEIDHNKVSGCMYSPDPNSSSSDIKVQLSRGQSECLSESTENSFWSSPFFLVPSTGSTSVLVPQPSKNAGYIVSVTSSTVAGAISGRTRIITFQPRYVISNACSKDLYYKQKGTDSVSHLRIGQHSQIHFADTARELLVSVRFDEPAWQWSGCFLPEHLGDTQLKMRNYVSGAVTMIRVEVQNADVSTRDEKIVGSSNGNSGTNLILLSDDDTGFMPYRIDNFSKERLRIYQQRCETFETIVHAYTSCPYAWDEPCFPHRLIVEVPGERVVGSYALDDVKEYAPVYLTGTSEKPERTLFVYVQAEGVVKVLSIVDSTCHNLNDLKSPHVTKSKEKRKEDQKQETSAQYKDKISFSISFIGISVMNSYPQELLYASAKNTTIDLVRSMDQETFSLQMSSLQIDNQLHSTPYPVILSFEHENRSNTVGQVRSRDDNTRFVSESELQIADSLCDPVFTLAAAKWRNTDTSLVSFEYISLKVADFHLELEQEVILSLFDFYKTISSRFDSSILPDRVSTLRLSSDFGLVEVSSTYTQAHEVVKANGDQLYASNIPKLIDNRKNSSLFPSVLPIGAPWQHIYLLARKQKKIYVELFDLAPINLTLSFSSSPWMLRNGVLTSGESVIHRGLMALADIEGAQIHLKQLVIAHQLASWESIQVILIRHYNRQFLHEMYKVFGSAGVIGNPMGFARRVGLGIRDFLSVPARSLVKNPAGLFIGMAQGTTSLLSNTVYAISDAATQFSRAAHKGIVAFTFDDQSVAKMEKQQFGVSSHSKGVINEFLEGLTGLLQSPIKGAEKHGLPGVLSGIALGVTGLVARPAASILEVTGKTAQSIRNRSKLHMGSQRFRVRLPRPLSRELPLRPYSWEEAVGSSVLSEAGDGLKLKDEMLVMCKTLKQGGKFVIITERLVLIVSCSSLVDLGKPRFRGIPADPGWVIEAEIGMDSVIHASADMEVVHILGSSSDALSRQNQHQHKRSGGTRGKRGSNSATPIPFFQTDVDFTCNEEAENFLQVLLSTIKKGKELGWGAVYLLHQSNLK